MLESEDIRRIRQFLTLDRTQITVALITAAAELFLKATNNRAFYNLVVKKPLQMLKHLIYQLQKVLNNLQSTINNSQLPAGGDDHAPSSAGGDDRAPSEDAPSRKKKTKKPAQEDLSNNVSAGGADRAPSEDAPSEDAPSEDGPSKTEEPRTVVRGKRDDHDYLPPEIRQIYDESWKLKDAIRTQQILLKEYERRTKEPKPEERSIFIKKIIKLDKEYRQKWEIYDNYKL